MGRQSGTVAEDGSHRRENITDWALEQFASHYHDPSITEWDIFYYIYAVLHHPKYRERYATNLRRELPRIPFASCHPDEAESQAKPATPEEGPLQLAGSTAAASEYIGPSARKERGPQDDKEVFRALVTTRIQADERREERRETRLPRHQNEAEQRQNHAYLQPIPNFERRS
jgi:hypothetical protein